MEYKMSKSNPKSAIYVHDSQEDIRKKINGAYCPEKMLEGNPLFNYLDLVLVDDKTAPIRIERPSKFGGALEFPNYPELVKAYTEGRLHPVDLKMYVSDGLEKKIGPVREYFEKNKRAKELYEQVKQYAITR